MITIFMLNKLSKNEWLELLERRCTFNSLYLSIELAEFTTYILGIDGFVSLFLNIFWFSYVSCGISTFIYIVQSNSLG